MFKKVKNTNNNRDYLNAKNSVFARKHKSLSDATSIYDLKIFNTDNINETVYEKTKLFEKMYSVVTDPVIITIEEAMDWELENDAWEWFYRFNYDFERATRFVFDRFYYTLIYFGEFNRMSPEFFYKDNKTSNKTVYENYSFFFSDDALFYILSPSIFFISFSLAFYTLFFFLSPSLAGSFTNKLLSFIDKLNSLFDSDSSSGHDLKKMFFIIFCFVVVPFYASFVLNSINSASSRLIIIYIIISSCIIFSSFFVLYSLGYLFLSFLKGTDSKSSIALNFFFDFMAVMSFFARYVLQTVRPVLALALYFLLHEYVFSFQNDANIQQIIMSSQNSKTPSLLLSFTHITMSLLRFFYEAVDFIMVFVLQMSAFIAVVLILFSFLFTSIPNDQYERFIKIKNEKKKNFTE